jgi:hypothetical protein
MACEVELWTWKSCGALETVIPMWVKAVEGHPTVINATRKGRSLAERAMPSYHKRLHFFFKSLAAAKLVGRFYYYGGAGQVKYSAKRTSSAKCWLLRGCAWSSTMMITIQQHEWLRPALIFSPASKSSSTSGGHRLANNGSCCLFDRIQCRQNGRLTGRW